MKLDQAEWTDNGPLGRDGKCGVLMQGARNDCNGFLVG